MEDLSQERSEKGLLVFLIVISAYMIVNAQQWGFQTSVFPEFTAGVTLVGATLLLGRRYLPGPIQVFVASSVRLFEQSEESVEEELTTEEVTTEEVTTESEPDRPLSPTRFTAALIALYIGLGTLFGVWWVTPLFIIAYGLWFRVPWAVTGVLVLLSFALIYIFKFIFIVPVDEGLLLEPIMELFV